MHGIDLKHSILPQATVHVFTYMWTSTYHKNLL